MTFVVDAQLPPAFARVYYVTEVAVREIGLRDATDSEIWHYAIQREGGIITKDDDFAERCKGVILGEAAFAQAKEAL